MNKTRNYLVSIGLVASSFVAVPALAGVPFDIVETENLRLIYFGGLHGYMVPYVTQCYENSLAYHKKFFDYEPSEPVTVFLHDFMDYGNAGASTAPRNRITLGAAPINNVFETTPANERMNSSMHHELLHIVAAEKPTGRDRFFRFLFSGKVYETSDNPLSIIYAYLTNPRRSAPRWFHEGTAVFMETWMSGGLGRSLGPWDEMVFRTRVREERRLYGVVALESEGTKVDFQVGVNAYLYGARFMTYLAREYGPQTVVDWISRSPGSKAYFASQFKKIFGLSLQSGWDNWLTEERSFQQLNLDSIKQYPLTPYRTLCKTALGSVSRAYYDVEEQKLYAAVNYPGKVAHLAELDIATGDLSSIKDVKGPALYFVSAVALDPESKTLFYTTDNAGLRDIRAIYLDGGKSETLQKDSRIGDLAFCKADSSLWGMRHDNGISTIVRIPPPYDKWNFIYSWPYGKDLYDIDVSPDGKKLSGALAEISGRQSLITFDIDRLRGGDTTYTELFDFHNSIPANFVFSNDSRYLYGSSYYTGVSNIFRYDFELDSMEVLSNCETGMFRPIPLDGDSLIAFLYTSDGFVPVIIPEVPLEDVSAIRYMAQDIVEKYPIVTEWIAPPPSRINLDSVITDSGAYHGFSTVRIVSAYPVVEGYGEYAAFGSRFELSSLLGLHHGDVTLSYTPNKNLAKDERFHGRFQYGYMGWNVSGAYNAADFYDLVGPTKTSRKGYSLGLSRSRTLVYDDPRSLDLNVSLTGYGGLEKLPEAQNIATSFEEFAVGSVRLDYSNLKASLGAVDYEKGIKWQLITTATYVKDDLFPRFFGTLDWGFPLPWRHSSFWLRGSAGYSPGDRDEPFSNFFFGGFGNNWVDYQDTKRYRSYYAFPGVELNEIGGTNFAKVLLDWSLPPVRFRTLGTPGFYISWARLGLFSTGIITNIDSRLDQSKFANAGAQIDLRMVMLSHINLTFSAGYAVAYPEYQRRSEEWMFSLKVM